MNIFCLLYAFGCFTRLVFGDNRKSNNDTTDNLSKGSQHILTEHSSLNKEIFVQHESKIGVEFGPLPNYTTGFGAMDHTSLTEWTPTVSILKMKPLEELGMQEMSMKKHQMSSTSISEITEPLPFSMLLDLNQKLLLDKPVLSNSPPTFELLPSPLLIAIDPNHISTTRVRHTGVTRVN